MSANRATRRIEEENTVAMKQSERMKEAPMTRTTDQPLLHEFDLNALTRMRFPASPLDQERIERVRRDIQELALRERFQ